MLGCLFGTACLVGLVGLYKGRRWRSCHGGGHYGQGGCGHGRWHGHGCGGSRHRHGGHGYGPFARGGAWDEDDAGEGDGGMFQGFALRHVFERLRTTPAQEREITAAIADLKKAARGTRQEWRDTKEQVARALRGDDFNAEILGAIFSQHDDVIEGLRKELVGTLARVHEVLDERQREELARLLERRGFAPRWA